MTTEEIQAQYGELSQSLTINCEQCSGLCCVALYCLKSDGFPADKAPGKPCRNLQANFRCAIHPRLADQKMRGCLAYDCFGAGQAVTKNCYPNVDWRSSPARAEEIFQVFLIVFRLRQMVWYLLDVLALTDDPALLATARALIAENEAMAAAGPQKILSLDVEQYQKTVNQLLRRVSQELSGAPPEQSRRQDFFAHDFKKADLEGRDLSMTLLIAANLEGCNLQGVNFLGADLRDANLRNTDLRECAFLTQMQINSALGNAATQLPARLSRPAHWQQ